MNRQISPELLKSFLTIADEGSFQRAANRIGRTQSAVSMQIKRLEDMLGHKLFTRERPNVRLTPKGETLLSYARRFLELQDEVWDVLAEPKAEGTVRFGIPDDYASGLLPRILEGFAQSEPQIEVAVHCATTVQLMEMIDAGDLDLALISRRDGSSLGQLIKEEQLVWASSPKHAVHLKDPIPLAVFQEDCMIRQSATDNLMNTGRRHRIAYSSPNLAALLAVTNSGLAIAALPLSSVPQTLRILSEKDGFPKLPSVEIALIKNTSKPSKAIEALAVSITNLNSPY